LYVGTTSVCTQKNISTAAAAAAAAVATTVLRVPLVDMLLETDFFVNFLISYNQFIVPTKCTVNA
jgi:hypothetical protein